MRGSPVSRSLARAVIPVAAALVVAGCGSGAVNAPAGPLPSPAQQTAAILTTFNECDMSEVMALRKKAQEKFTADHGLKLGFMSFFIKATVEALKAVPAINSRIEGDDFILNHYYDIGVAVGTERGLVVPVVAINKQTGMIEGIPDIITRGFVMENSQELLAEGARVLSEVMEQSSIEERTV